jgi:DNA ligase-associated metallophosphoesterase
MATQCSIQFASEELILDAAGAIFWPTEKALLFADLHLEKGSYLMKQGELLPPYDTKDTLARIEKLILAYQAKQVICLGDNLHDYSAIERMQLEDYRYLCQLAAKVEWRWIIGNHDTQSLEHPLLKFFKFYPQYPIRSILLTHDFNTKATYQIIGHFHPKATFCIRSQAIKGKCFVVNDALIVMPAFGSYTGGLDILSPVFQQLLQTLPVKYFLLQREKIWQINI